MLKMGGVSPLRASTAESSPVLGNYMLFSNEKLIGMIKVSPVPPGSSSSVMGLWFPRDEVPPGV